MNTFAEAMTSPDFTETTNGMPALTHTGESIVNLFYSIGASRNALEKVTLEFFRAFGDNPTLAARTLMWARDIRGGAGERKVFRHLMLELEKVDITSCKKMIPLIPEYGRWDDLLIFTKKESIDVAFATIAEGLKERNGLCAKWMPRKGVTAVHLRKFLGLTPRDYRKLLVNLTNVVEQKMCAQDWKSIEYSKLPSMAAKIYMNAFNKHDPSGYGAYKNALTNGAAKINAGAIFPHDVLRGIANGDITVATAQWEALPNYLGDNSKILAVVDTSGSMTSAYAQASSGLTVADVAWALGLYIADKQKGPFNGFFCTFNAIPEFIKLTGSLATKMNQISRAAWGGNTNLEAVFTKLLQESIKHEVAPEDMPSMILILSDMQFDGCVREPSESAINMIRNNYENAGYKIPKVVFWNLEAFYGNVPVSHSESGVALVSGFSPAILTKLMKAEDFTPMSIVLDTLNSDRYNQINL